RSGIPHRCVLLHRFMHDLGNGCDYGDLLVCGVCTGYGVGSIRGRHKGSARIPDAIGALWLHLALLLLLATFTANGTAATTTATTTTPATAAAAFFPLRCCRRAIELCVDCDGGINLRHVLLRWCRLRGLVAFRMITALLSTTFAPATTLLLIFVPGFATLAVR